MSRPAGLPACPCGQQFGAWWSSSPQRPPVWPPSAAPHATEPPLQPPVTDAGRHCLRACAPALADPPGAGLRPALAVARGVGRRFKVWGPDLSVRPPGSLEERGFDRAPGTDCPPGGSGQKEPSGPADPALPAIPQLVLGAGSGNPACDLSALHLGVHLLVPVTGFGGSFGVASAGHFGDLLSPPGFADGAAPLGSGLSFLLLDDDLCRCGWRRLGACECSPCGGGVGFASWNFRAVGCGCGLCASGACPTVCADWPNAVAALCNVRPDWQLQEQDGCSPSQRETRLGSCLGLGGDTAAVVCMDVAALNSYAELLRAWHAAVLGLWSSSPSTTQCGYGADSVR